MALRDRDVFAEFVTARSGALHRAAYLMVGDAALAQDLVQEALTKTYVAWPRLRDPANAEAYTRKAITTTAISWFRRRSWSERPAEHLPEHVVAGHGDAVDDRAWLWDALQSLPARQRAAVVLRHYEDLSEAQTAAAMGCSVGAVKSQTSAGLAKLRDRLRDDPALVPHLDPVDLDAITGAAERQVRRRRAAVVAGAVVVVLVGAVALAGLRGDGRVEPAPVVPSSVVWAAGTEIHTADEVVDVGRPIDAFVRTTQGYVVASAGEVWSILASGNARVGAIAGARPRLVGDDESGLVAWQQPDDARGITVLDQATGRTTLLESEARVLEVMALDAGSVFVRTPQGGVVLDAASGEAVRSVVGGPWNVLDAEDDLVAMSDQQGVLVGTRGTDFRILDGVDGRVSNLSPDARWLAVPSVGDAVFDTATGERVAIDVDAEFALPYGWSDPTTLLVLAGDRGGVPGELVACVVPAGTCASVATLPPFAQDADVFEVQLPTGRPLEDF